MKQTPDKSVAAQIRMTEDCTGCAACANVCPVGAIKMEPYEQEGFYKPYVDPQICINCGLCTKTCPQYEYWDKNQEEPACYAAMAPDDIRLKSSSGGAFTILAEEILRRGGVVCGAAFDENWRVHHILVEDEAGLERLRGSKYVQSFVSEDIFKQIKSHLEEGRIVLFSGVSCQVAGLYNFLRKDYENLYTVDIICAYTPSPKIFAQYLAQNYNDADIISIKFRDKTTRGWGAWHNTIVTSRGVIEENRYIKPYLSGIFKGEHCVNCKFKRFPRPGDFTIGDFWRINEFKRGLDDRWGTSGVLLNNEKARELFELVRKNFKTLTEMPLHTMGWQVQVLPRKEYRTNGCINFYKNMDNRSFNENSVESPREVKVGILNWWFLNNRGAILTNYALNEMVRNLGYAPLTVNYITPFERKNYERGYAKAFSEKYINKTRLIHNVEELKWLNDEIGNFICGSDQIFNFARCRIHEYLYYMGWVDSARNKLISYAASIADRVFRAHTTQKNLVKYWLRRFDHISVREEEARDLLKDLFNLESELVLDPVFCIDRQKYVDIANQSSDKIEEPYIVHYYTNRERCNHPELIAYAMKGTGAQRVIDLTSWNIPMENWLWYIQHAKFVLTNSFHGICFSLMFNRPFGGFILDPAWDTRYSCLTALCDKNQKIFSDWRHILKDRSLFESPDSSYFNDRIVTMREKSEKWLFEALSGNKVNHLTEEQQIIDSIVNLMDEVGGSLRVRCAKLEQAVTELRKRLDSQ